MGNHCTAPFKVLITIIDEDDTKIQWGKGVEENMTDNDHDAGDRKKLHNSQSHKIVATKTKVRFWLARS